MAEHKHAEVIRAYANGAEIEIYDAAMGWLDIGNPSWIEKCQYRVKPTQTASGYPQTKMTPGDLGATFIHSMMGVDPRYAPEFSIRTMDRLVTFANNILQRAVEDGTVPTKEAYEQCSRDLLYAEKLLESLGYRRTMLGEWEAPMPDTQAQRDMKVAEAVRSYINGLSLGYNLDRIDLAVIIAGVK